VLTQRQADPFGGDFGLVQIVFRHELALIGCGTFQRNDKRRFIGFDVDELLNFGRAAGGKKTDGDDAYD